MRGAAVWIALRAPGAREDVDGWQAELEALLQTHGRELQMVEILLDVQPTALADYIIRIGSTVIRSKHDGILVALGGVGAPSLSALYTPQLAAFVDVLALHEDEVAAGKELVASVDPDARIVVTGMDGGSDVATARLRLLNSVLESVGTRVAAHAWKATAITSAALPVLTPISGLITGDITTLDSSASALRLQLGADEATATLPHRLLFDQRTFATYLVYWGAARSEPLSVTLMLPVEGTPLVEDLLHDRRQSAQGYARNADTGLVTARVPLTGGPMLVDFNAGAAPVFAERTGVSASRRLSIDEIIARHQQQQRAQDALGAELHREVRMAQHFRPNVADPGYDVVTSNRYFVAGDRSSGRS